jgi:hypothetical protein
MNPRRAAAVLAVVLSIALLAGCGEEERRFDAESVIAELNAGGAGLELGEPLTVTEEDVEVRSVELIEAEAEPGAEPSDGDEDEHGHAHGAAAVVILADSEKGLAEFQRCETAPAFICFRAANAVLRFTEITPEEQARISAAFVSLQSEG